MIEVVVPAEAVDAAMAERVKEAIRAHPGPERVALRLRGSRGYKTLRLPEAFSMDPTRVGALIRATEGAGR